MPDEQNCSYDTLLTELANAEIKHNPAQIIRIGKSSGGKIIFLEIGRSGKGGSGLAHIIERHQQDFEKRNITAEEIPDLIIQAATHGNLLNYQGRDRAVYGVSFKGRLHKIAVTIGNNGYIVGANPAT